MICMYEYLISKILHVEDRSYYLIYIIFFMMVPHERER